MEREILFRGKRTGNGERVEGHLIVFPKSKITKIMVWNMADIDFDAIEVRPETVGQFTGLTDIHGKRIFEGDIVKSFNISGELEGIGAVNLNDLFCCWQFGKKAMYGGLVGCYEVIGNIHDNSELLNGKES